MGKLDRAWQLFNESLTVLNADIEILLFPVMSGISAEAIIRYMTGSRPAEIAEEPSVR